MNEIDLFDPVFFSEVREAGKPTVNELTLRQRLINYAESFFAFGTSYAVFPTQKNFKVTPLHSEKRNFHVAALISFVIVPIFIGLIYPQVLGLLSFPIFLLLLKISHHGNRFILEDSGAKPSGDSEIRDIMGNLTKGLNFKFPDLNSRDSLLSLTQFHEQIADKIRLILHFTSNADESSKEIAANVLPKWNQKMRDLEAYVENNQVSIGKVVETDILPLLQEVKDNCQQPGFIIPVRTYYDFSFLYSLKSNFGKQLQSCVKTIDLDKYLEELSKQLNPRVPIGLKNLGNSCYLNSAFVLLMHVPFLRQKLDEAIELMAKIKLSSMKDQIDQEAKKEWLFLDAMEEILKESRNKISAPDSLWQRLRNGKVCVSKKTMDRLRKACFDSKVLLGPKSDQYDSSEVLIEFLNLLHTPIDLRKILEVENSEIRQESQVKEPSSLMLSVEIAARENSISLTESIAKFFSTDLVEEELRRVIDGKEQKFPSSNQTFRIGVPPPVILVHLKRFERIYNIKKGIVESRKINDPVYFDPDVCVDLAEFCLPDSTGQLPSARYRLAAVNIHLGEIGSGHYYSLVKKETSWFKCNDSQISPIENVKEELKDGYIFVFERI